MCTYPNSGLNGLSCSRGKILKKDSPIVSLLVLPKMTDRPIGSAGGVELSRNVPELAECTRGAC